MKKLNLKLALSVLLGNLLLSFNTFADVFEHKIQELIEHHLPHTAVGIIIQDPTTGKVIYENRAEENFYPASNTKLFTAAAALKFFGPNFHFQTTLHGPLDKLKDGTLDSDLFIIFRGDPSLSTTDLSQLFQQLSEKGVKEIKGNIVIDDKTFEAPFYAPGWTYDSIAWYYSAPITSIILNQNKVRLKVNKPATLGEQVKIEQADERIPSLKILTNVTAVSYEESEHSCQLNATVINNDISLEGCWPIDKTPTFIELALDSPRSLAKSVIQQSLNKLNIKHAGNIIFEKAPKNIPAILTKRSPPLKDLLVEVLAESNNVYTESFTKALGLAYLGQGTFQTGIRAIQEILAKDSHMKFSQMRMSDGSGQSRYNLVSPYLISQLLYHMYQDPQFQFYHSALSVSGKNGSLALRLKDNALLGKIVGKTGSATGSSALSGYFTAKSGKEYIFSLLINQSIKDPNALKMFEDKICQYMIEEPWLTPPEPSVPT